MLTKFPSVLLSLIKVYVTRTSWVRPPGGFIWMYKVKKNAVFPWCVQRTQYCVKKEQSFFLVLLCVYLCVFYLSPPILRRAVIGGKEPQVACEWLHPCHHLVHEEPKWWQQALFIVIFFFILLAVAGRNVWFQNHDDTLEDQFNFLSLATDQLNVDYMSQ